MDDNKTDQSTEATPATEQSPATTGPMQPKVMDVQPPSPQEDGGKPAETDMVIGADGVPAAPGSSTPTSSAPVVEASEQVQPQSDQPAVVPTVQNNEQPVVGAQAPEDQLQEVVAEQPAQKPEMSAEPNSEAVVSEEPAESKDSAAEPEESNEQASADTQDVAAATAVPVAGSSKKSGSGKPMATIAIIVIVAVLLVTFAVLAYLNSSSDPVSSNDQNNDAVISQPEVDQSAQLPIDPNVATDEVIADIDQSINTLDEDTDYSEAEITDQNLEL